MTNTTHTLGPELLRKMDAYWRAANYLSVGQVYLYDRCSRDEHSLHRLLEITVRMRTSFLT